MLYARESPNSTLCPLGQSNKAIGHESPIGPCVATHRWTTIRLVVFQKNDGRRHNNEMEPQGRTIASPLQTRRQSKTFRLGKTTLRVRAHVQAVGLNAKTKNLPALSRRGDFSLDIPFYRTRRLARESGVALRVGLQYRGDDHPTDWKKSNLEV